MSKNLEEIRGFKNAAIGTIMAWSGSSSELPTGWLSCDGAAVSNDDYPLLKDVIGYTYGGSDAANEFELPNLNNGRVPFHKGSTFIGQGGNNTASTTLNADWSINGRPNKTIQYNAAQVNSNDGNNAFTRNDNQDTHIHLVDHLGFDQCRYQCRYLDLHQILHRLLRLHLLLVHQDVHQEYEVK